MYLHLIREAKFKGKGGRSGCKPFCTADSACRYAYDFNDIGNRESSCERCTNAVYVANQLNQYISISNSALSVSPRVEFIPQFDDDGNQTLIQTATGIWSATYNGENRPIFWVQGTNTISMSYDRMGRRVTKNNQRFIYDGYLQIANSELQTPNSKLQTFIWDPTEPVATRPLVWIRENYTFYYAHDGNKNVSEVISDEVEVDAHYEYAPFGVIAVKHGVFAADNPWRFSSEYTEDNTSTVYFNYCHYEPVTGRWMRRDPIEAINYYVWCDNNLIGVDFLGLTNEPGAFGWSNYSVEQRQCCNGKPYSPSTSCCRKGEISTRNAVYSGVSYFCMHKRWWYQTIVRIRPFSIRQFALTHCWLNVDGNRFGAYPNGRFLKDMQADGQSIQDDSHHAKDESAWSTSRTDVELSPCRYDIESFKNCMLAKRNAPWTWTAWNNCGDFVEVAVEDCKKSAQYD